MRIQKQRQKQTGFSAYNCVSAVAPVTEASLMIPVSVSNAVNRGQQVVNPPVDYETVRQAASILRTLLLSESVVSVQAQGNLDPKKVALLLEV
jgi:hypothetical protein